MSELDVMSPSSSTVTPSARLLATLSSRPSALRVPQQL